MFVAMNRLRAPTAFAERIEQGFAHAAPGMREVPGFIDSRLLRLGSQPDGAEALYIAETTWRDEESYQAWAHGDVFARAHGGGGSGSPLTATLELFTIVPGQDPSS